jgi:cephalosporin-C deacetylase-like acetyl esterase
MKPPLAQDMLSQHLLRRFEELEEQNARRRTAMDTADAWRTQREELLAHYRQMLGRFPERSPLEARVTGRIERETYTIEKLIYESQPGFLVTAMAYVPKERLWPVPGVLVPCGHSENGKAAETYQRVCAGLASKGYFVLIYDPLGQGERKLYWNRERAQSDIGGGTTEHSYAGNQCFLLGFSLAQYMVWDSIRGVDYLLSRPEVDPERIAMAGNSGGGTNTAQTVPVDERIKVAVPCCYITTLAWRRRSWTTGDAEQNLVGQLAAGLDHADLVRLVAPRPVLVGSAALDYFPLQGAQQSVEIARDLYGALGVPERVAHVVAEAPHGYSVDLRRATYSWLNRWFDNEAAGDDEPDTVVETDADCQCTPAGQVALLGSETVHRLNQRRLQMPVPARTLPVAQALREMTMFEGPGDRPVAYAPEAALFAHEGMRRVETVTLWPEPDVAVPGLVHAWRAPMDRRRAFLWLDAEGKETANERTVFRSLLDNLLPAGWLVLSVDVRGVGETAPRIVRGQAQQRARVEAFLTYESFIAGRPLFGMRLRDAAGALEYLLDRPDVDPSSGVTVAGWGAGGLLALHLAALDERVSAVATIDTLASYRSLVEHERYGHHISWLLPGAVRNVDSPNGYEVDDVADLVRPRPLLRLRSVDHTGVPPADPSDEEIASALRKWILERR